MTQRANAITMKGNPLTLIGPELNVGDQAPDFTVLDNGLGAVSLADAKGKVVVLCSVPSLDTSVCDTEIRRFNQAATSLSDNVEVWAISCDLPFAQQRWCGQADVTNVRSLSDHRDVSFGEAYGVLIKELRLLGRAVFVVDAGGKIAYAELVKEVTDEPNYDAALQAAAEAAKA